ncbi:glucose-1-phosphate adenylyltransferase [Agilicoccus flavus]|uniref:glucose-1-phosphate adenylyltransferase n=1 Tax=Agilicoccus flavus TaxID=2775968 RepID=UPI001CF6E841|nr:glucose-1-phosphate adenylyltransferase [Agilicoccus flavus]
MRRTPRNPNVLAIVLAGGEGKRLMPLTADRAKPAVPFGGIYRLVDFALSNVVNSGYLKVVVLTQYKSHSLDRHVTRTWRMSTLLGNYVAPIPAQQRVGKNWYLGSADAIYQSLNTLEDERPDIVVVVGADHVYRMDFSQMVDQHIETGAGVTVAAIRQPISLADQFGVIEVDGGDRRKIGRWREKPTDAIGLPDSPDEVLASMGNYVFDADVLREVVTKDAENADSKHDMGGDIVPYFVDRDEGYVYDFKDNEIPNATERDKAYWRDVGTIDSYYDANRDLIAIHPVFNLYNAEWPIYTSYGSSYPPAKFVHNEAGRLGEALNSAVSPGVVVSGAHVDGSVISPRCQLHSYSQVHDSVLLDNVEIHRKAVVEKAILDKNVVLEEGAEVGVDHDRDRERGFHVSAGGIVVVPKGAVVTA